MPTRGHEHIYHGLDVRETTDGCVLVAMIIHVHQGENFADIELPPAHGGGRVDRVPIFYHCQKARTVRGGWSAFMDDMPVVVLKRWHRQGTRADYVVVSPADGLAECRRPFMFLAGADYLEAIEVKLDDRPELFEGEWKFSPGETVSVFGEDGPASAQIVYTGDQIGKHALHPWTAPPENVIIGDFPTGFWKDNLAVTGPNATGRIKNVWRYHYATPRRFVPPREVLAAFVLEDYADGWSLPHPGDTIAPMSDSNAFGDTPPPLARTWAKTCREVTVVAARWQTPGELVPEWGLCATLGGEPILFPGGRRLFGPTPAGGYGGMPPKMTMHHMGFDVWMEGGKYYVSMAFEGAGEYLTTVWSVDEEEKALVLESEERPAAVMTDHEEWDPMWVRLVGLGKRTPYYCRFNRNFYWEGNNGQIVSMPGGAIKTILWDPTRREPEIHWRSNLETESSASAYAVYTGGSNYYWPPYSCIVYDNGTYVGYNCRDAIFDGGTPTPIDLTRGGITITVVYGAGSIRTGSGAAIANISYNYSWYDVSNGQVTFFSDNKIGSVGEVEGGSRNRFSAGRTGCTIQGTGTVQWSLGTTTGRFCMAHDAREIAELRWIFDPSNAPAGTYQQRDLEGEVPDPDPDSEPEDTVCEWGDWYEVNFGRGVVGENAAGWPYESWKAILLEGEDCKGTPIDAPAVVYSNGAIVTAGGHVVEGDAAAAMRQVFFTSRMVPEEC